MKIPTALLALALGAMPLVAADWPAAFEHYEAAALEHPGRNDATWQMWRYAVSTGRLEELKQRWEAKASEEKGEPYRLLLALLAESETDFRGAQSHFEKAIAAAPNDATAWLLRGESQSIQRLPDARASLEKALELELAQGLAPAAAEPLAENLLTAGLADDARAALDRALPAVRAPEDWLRLTQKRAEAAMAQGRLPELLAQLEKTPPGPLGGSETAQAYVAAQDYAQASAELARAQKERPNDALLHAQALQVARAANRTSEIARLLRAETNLAPTSEKSREFFRALVANGEADEARAVLRDQGAALFAEPLAWRELLPALWQAELSRPVAEILVKPASGAHWDAALLRAELLIAEKDWPSAEEALWSILDPQCEAQPLASSEKTWAIHPAGSEHDAAMPEAHFHERTTRMGKYLQWTPAPFNPRVAMAADRMTPVETLLDARDLALLYLAAIAAETHRAPEFVVRLEQRIAGWPRTERMLAWCIVQNPPHALAEMAGYANETRTAQIDRFCREELPAIRRLPLASSDAEHADALAKIFPEDASREKFPPASLDYGERFRKSDKAFREGRFDEARKLFAETSAAFRAAGCPIAERESVACGMSFAFLLPDLRDAAQTSEGAITAVRSAFPDRKPARWPGIGEGLKALSEPETPALSYRYFERGNGEPPRADDLSPTLRGELVFPPSPLFSWERVGILWTVFGQTRNAATWRALKERLDAEIARTSGDEAFYLRTTAAYLAWWNEDFAGALARMKQLLAETNDPRIGLGLASMLNRQGDSKAALATLAELKPPTPNSARAIAAWRLALLAKFGDTAAATTEARQLAEGPWEAGDLRDLLGLLQKYKCDEAAAALRPRLLEEETHEEDVHHLELAIQDLSAPDSTFKPDALAERILASTPPVRDWRPANERMTALRAIRKSGGFDDYLARMHQATEAAPQNAAAWHRLAEASTGTGAADAWRKVLELQPASLGAARELAALAESNEAKRQAFEKLLALDPEEAVQEHGDLLFSNYLEAKQLPQLAEAISKAPFRPASWRAGMQNSFAWRERAEQFVDARQPEAALLVLRKAITTFDPVPADLRQILLDQLMALNRREEAARELVECLAPAKPEASPLFAWQTLPDAPTPRKAIDPSLLKMARSLGIAPELRARVHTAAEHDATARAVSAFLRAADREPAAVAEIRAMIPEVKSGGDTSWVVPLATEIAGWPEAAETCREMLSTYDHAMDRNSRYSVANRLEVAHLLALAGGKDEAVQRGRAALENARKNPKLIDSWRAPRTVGEIAIAATDASLLADCTHALTEMLAAQPSRGFSDAAEAISFAGELLDANHPDQADEIFGALRKMPNARNNPAMNSALTTLEMEAALRKGDWRLATPLVWLDPANSPGKPATLGWDLGVSTRISNGAAPQSVTRAEAVPAFAGRLAVELFVGEDAESMQPVAQLSGVGSRGVWQGQLPAKAGFARVVISDQDKVLIGEASAICAGPNLLREGDGAKFLPTLPGGEVQREKGGPTSEGEHISLRPADRVAGNPSPPSLGPQVRIKPGRDYQLECWVRTAGNRTMHLGWRCLDGNGKSVGTGFIPAYNVGDRYWVHCAQRLSWPRNNATYQRLPITTVFLEPTLEGGGAGDIAGLSLVELPTPETESEP